MPTSLRTRLPLALPLALVACGGAELDPPQAEPTWWEDARPIVQQRCATCHTDGDIAPFPLTTVDEVRAYADLVRIAVESGTMPPWPAGDDCNTYANDRSLTDEEKATLLAWLDAGLPEGDPTATTEAPADEALDADLVLTMPEPYTPTLQPDDYRCLLIEWPEQEERFITGLQVLPDRRDMVHHVIAFAASADAAADYVAKDEAEEGPGYTCYGGPSGSADMEEVPDLGSLEDMEVPARWIGSWVPGSGGGRFPDGTGIRIRPGELLIVQMHYNTLTTTPGPDQSSIAFQLADTVDRPASVLPLADPGWVTDGALGPAMTIPAGEADVTHSTVLYPVGGPLFDAVVAPELGLAPGDPVEVHVAGHHMHTLGTSGRIGIQHADGADTCLLDIPRWDFHWQGGYVLDAPVLLGEGDGVEISCTWDNSAGAEDVSWGEGTTDEMCLAVLYVTAE